MLDSRNRPPETTPRCPLGICDGRSIPRTGFILVQRRYKDRTGEVYHYSAQFGDYEVIVTANPVMRPKQPVTPVDTQRACDLLVKAVAAVRS